MAEQKIIVIFALAKHNGAWAGRLGNGLQNRVGRFDSARHLTKNFLFKKFFFVLSLISFSYFFLRKEQSSYVNGTHKKRHIYESIDMSFCLLLKGLSGNLVGIRINLCKSIQKEFFINDTP